MGFTAGARLRGGQARAAEGPPAAAEAMQSPDGRRSDGSFADATREAAPRIRGHRRPPQRLPITYLEDAQTPIRDHSERHDREQLAVLTQAERHVLAALPFPQCVAQVIAMPEPGVRTVIDELVPLLPPEARDGQFRDRSSTDDQVKARSLPRGQTTADPLERIIDTPEPRTIASRVQCGTPQPICSTSLTVSPAARRRSARAWAV